MVCAVSVTSFNGPLGLRLVPVAPLYRDNMAFVCLAANERGQRPRTGGPPFVAGNRTLSSRRGHRVPGVGQEERTSMDRRTVFFCAGCRILLSPTDARPSIEEER